MVELVFTIYNINNKALRLQDYNINIIILFYDKNSSFFFKNNNRKYSKNNFFDKKSEKIKNLNQ